MLNENALTSVHPGPQPPDYNRAIGALKILMTGAELTLRNGQRLQMVQSESTRLVTLCWIVTRYEDVNGSLEPSEEQWLQIDLSFNAVLRALDGVTYNESFIANANNVMNNAHRKLMRVP